MQAAAAVLLVAGGAAIGRFTAPLQRRQHAIAISAND
jgi:hypothetical protein